MTMTMHDPSSSTVNLRSYRWRVQLGLLPPPSVHHEVHHEQDQWSAAQAAAQADYQRLVELHPFPGDHQDNEVATAENESATAAASTSTCTAMDPLTAMLMEEQSKTERLHELDLKYRTEKARRKRGLGLNNDGGGRVFMEDEEYDQEAAALQIIDKDLERLPSPHSKRNTNESPLPLSPNSNSNNTDVDPDANDTDTNDTDTNNVYIKQRKAVLRQVLFIYQCEHPDPGYRQGMHEIASWLLHALQLDQDELLQVQLDATDDRTTSSTTTTTTTSDNVSALAADTYTMLVHILTAILPAYDGNNGDTGGLPAMSRRILSVIDQHCPALMFALTELHTPPQLYLIKWIRLLYSREVECQDDVLELWDALFFPSVAAVGNGNNNTRGHSWMAVLEYTAAARLLLWRNQILQGDSSSRLHLLMNLPVEQKRDISELVDLTRQLLDPDSAICRGVETLPEHSRMIAKNAIAQQQQQQPTTTDQQHELTTSTGPSSSRTTTVQQGQLHSMNTPSATSNSYSSSNNAFADYEGQDLASALANRFSLSAVKQSLEQAKTQTESIKKRLYHEWGSLAVTATTATNTHSHSDQHSNIQQQQQQHAHNNASTARTRNVADDPLRRNYDDPLMGGIDWSGGGSSSATAAIQPQFNGDSQPPHASSMYASPSFVPHAPTKYKSQEWARTIQASSAALQDFAMAMEKQGAQYGGGNNNNANNKVVPAAVWEALADLEVLRRDILSSSAST